MGENKEGQTEIKKLCSEIYRTIQKGKPRSSFDRIEDKLAWLILEQRYHNLSEFIQRQCEKYGNVDSKELLELWFIHNDLKEIQFIGPDLYANAMFVKHKVPYLYRSVGKDGRNLIQGEAIKPDELVVKRIFQECQKEIKTKGNEKVRPYSKCFGKMLYKYANIRSIEAETTTIEIRKDAYINAVSEDGSPNTAKSLQKYIQETNADVDEGTKRTIPYFAVDMSNVRDNSIENLKCWIDDYLEEKQIYIPEYDDIMSPIKDAEVVCDFTGDEQNVLCSNVERFTLNENEFCVLLYRYFLKYVQEDTRQHHNEEQIAPRMHQFKGYIRRSVDTIPEQDIKEFFTSILTNSVSGINNYNLQKIIENIDWTHEILYMRRENGEKRIEDGKIAKINPYFDKYATPKNKYWKDILFGAVNDSIHSHINFSVQKQELNLYK